MENVNSIILGSVVNNIQIFKKYLDKSLTAANFSGRKYIVDNIDNIITTNIASIYNSILRIMGSDLKIFLHPDVSFNHDFFLDIMEQIRLLENEGIKWGALGIVGRSFNGEYIWGHEINRPAKVCCLDSCSLITKTSFNMIFDQNNFDGFHSFIEDYCLQCHAGGFEVMVIPVKAYHASATMRQEGSQWGDYIKYRKRLGRKWKKLFKTIYTC